MNEDNFWRIARLSGVKTGIIARMSLALIVTIGSIALAWILLGTHNNAHASGLIETPTTLLPWGVAFDSKGHVWVAEPACPPLPVCNQPFPSGMIGEYNISDGSKVQEFSSAPKTYMPTFLVVDASGNEWFTDPSNKSLGELVPGTSTWNEWNAGLTANAQLDDLTFDGAGNIWFTEHSANKIGFFNPVSHTFQETFVGTSSTRPHGIVYDSTNNVIWFADQGTPNIGSFTPTANGVLSSGAVTMHPILQHAFFPHLIAIDKQQNVWFSEGSAGYIGELPHGSSNAKDFSICPTQPCTDFVAGIGVNSSGTVYFNDSQFKSIGALNPTTGNVIWTNLPNSNANPRDGLGIDSSNNVWFTDQTAYRLGKLAASVVPTPSPTTPPATGIGPTSPTWYFAEGKVGQGFTEFLTIQNPDPVNTCSVSIQYLLSTSTTTPIARTVAPNTRWTESVNGDLNVTTNSSSYQAVSTIVSVSNTNVCNGVVAERPIYFTNFKGVSGGTDVLGATHTGTDFYFADVSSLPGYNSYITILNPPGVSSANITVTYSLGGSQLGTDTHVVLPGVRGTIIPKSFGQRVTAWVHSSTPVVVERPTYFNNFSVGNAQNVSGSASVVGAPAPAKDWRFAEGYVGGQFQENLVLANFWTGTASGSLVLEYDNGSTLTVPVTVNGQNLITVDINATTKNLSGVCAPMPCALSQSVSAEIMMTTGSIVAEREMFFHFNHFDRALNRTTTAMGGTDVTGQSGSAKNSAYSFAEGYTNVGYDEWLTVQNPTTSPERVWVTLINGESHTYQFSISLGAHSRATVNIDDAVVQHLLHPDDGVGGYEVSMTVQTTDGSSFVAERPMYWNASGTQGGSDVIGYAGG